MPALNRTKIAIALLVVFMLSNQSHAVSIGINFSGGNGPVSLLPSEVAGVVAQANWNNATGASGGPLALVDSNGNPTVATVTHASNEAWGSGSPTEPNGKLLRGWISENGGPNSTIDILNIPYAKYDVIVYMHHDRTNEDVRLIGPWGNFDLIETQDDSGPASGESLASPVVFVQQTTSGTGPGNYALFTDLTGATLNLQLGAIDLGNGTIDRNAISAIQIVNTYVPEPATTSLALLGMGGLMMRRRRIA